MRCLVRYSLLLLLAGSPLAAPAQPVTDSVSAYLTLLDELVQAGNFEQAQLEATNFRALLQGQQILPPAAAIPLLSRIYEHNEDPESALSFLAEVLRATQLNPDPQSRAGTFAELVKAFNTWDRPAQAQTCLQLLEAARDSISEHERQLALRAVHRQLDSLNTLRHLELADQARYVRLERERAFMLGAALLLAFMGMALVHWRTVARWRKRLEKKDLENELLRSDRYTSTLSRDVFPVEMQEAVALPAERERPLTDKPSSGKTALLIEPNRQIVLYLKSLLSDHFQIETAGSASEGLQLAANHLPDLIVCDAVLNGITGIDVARQIKLSERTNHIPVILLTDRHGNEGKLDALRAGADAWFNRPVLHHIFEGEVRRLLDARKEKHELFARFLHLYYSENRIALDEPFLSRSIQLIDQHLSDPDFMADELARKMQLSKNLYFKKLQVLTGKEPMQLIREMRLEKAKALLEKRAGTPQAIAELVGFSSAGTFALAFKEYFGENTLLLLNDVRRL